MGMITVFDVYGDYLTFSEGEQFSNSSNVVGSSSCKFLSPAPYKNSIYWVRALELDDSLSNFAWPDRSCGAEKRSFVLQCDKHNVSKVPTKEQIQRSRHVLLPQYIRHKLPSFWLGDFIQGMRAGIQICKMYLKPDASPGVPYAFTASRNDKVVEALGSRLDDLVICRLLRRLAVSPGDIRTKSREWLIAQNLVDPVRVFVKGEGHKIKKIREGRVRLIMSVSIVDKMIEMLLMRHLAKLEIYNWDRIPSKPGIGFTKRDNDFVYNDVLESLPMSATDIEAWDWSCQEWQILEEAECQILLCDNPTDEWIHLTRIGALLESRSIYQFSDGVLVEPSFTGIVNSGKYKTSRGNSFMRSQLATIVGSDKCISAGDDTVESTVAGAVEKYAELGFKIKAYDDVVDRFEFCSRIYTAYGSWPVNYEKILMNLLHNIPTSPQDFRMYITQFIDDLEFHPEFQRIMGIVHQVGYFELAGAQEVVEDDAESSTTPCTSHQSARVGGST